VRLVVTLLVSDEAELVEANLDYHLDRGADLVVVTANRSPDEILEMLRPYADRGVVRVIEEQAQTYAQSEWVTRMARLAATEHGADWVINCDVDEFYWPEGGDLKEVLTAVPPEYGSLIMPVCHFVPRPEDGEEEHFADRMTVRETASVKPGLGTQFSKVAHRASPDVEVGRGNHEVTGVGLESLPAWRPILGLHFPVRSFAQFERKVVKDGLAVANNPDPKVSSGVWRHLYELQQAGGLAEHYAQMVVDDAEARAGVAEGRLVVDERLRRWFAARAEKAGTPASPDPERVEALGIDLRRTLREAEFHPLAVEVADLETKLRRTEKRLEKTAERLEKAKGRLRESEQRRRKTASKEAELRKALAAAGARRSGLFGLARSRPR
jgi:hypothetical protein